jgi:hypothetical protein
MQIQPDMELERSSLRGGTDVVVTTFDTGCIGGDEGLPDTPVDSASEKVGYLLVC